MKNFTAIQNTSTVKGMGYSFKANNLEEAIEKAPKLLSGEIIDIYEVDDMGNKVVNVITYLCNGGLKKVMGVTMYNNTKFEKKYNSLNCFLNEFYPTAPSEKLLYRIREEFYKTNGKITFKPKGYKSNQDFYFNV